MEIYQFQPIVLFYWLVAFAIWEWLFVSVSLKFSKSATYQEYYTKLPSWVPVTGDFLYSTLIFLAAQWVFPLIRPLFPLGFSPLAIFVIGFVAVQWTFDLTYGLIVSNLPSTTSRYVDFFQRYMKEFGFLAAVGDTIYGLFWIALTWLLIKYVPLSVAVFILISAVFLWMLVKW